MKNAYTCARNYIMFLGIRYYRANSKNSNHSNKIHCKVRRQGNSIVYRMFMPIVDFYCKHVGANGSKVQFNFRA